MNNINYLTITAFPCIYIIKGCEIVNMNPYADSFLHMT